MKVAFCSDDGRRLAARVARCSGFVIVEFTGRGWERIGFRRNPMAARRPPEAEFLIPGEAHPGEHTHEAILETLGDCRGLVTRGIESPIVDELHDAAIRPFLSTAMTVRDAARNFQQAHFSRRDRVSATLTGGLH